MPKVQKIGITLAIAFMVIAFLVIAKSYTPEKVDWGAMQRRSVAAGDGTSVVTIRTTGWTMVQTGGRNFTTKSAIVDGKTLHFYIAINKTNVWKELPTEEEVKWGLPSSIDRIYLRLKPGQGDYKEAELPIVLE